MFYFRKNDEVIEKYQIDFNKEEVETLKEKIINNCSFIKHEEYESDHLPRFTGKIILALNDSFKLGSFRNLIVSPIFICCLFSSKSLISILFVPLSIKL